MKAKHTFKTHGSAFPEGGSHSFMTGGPGSWMNVPATKQMPQTQQPPTPQMPYRQRKILACP
jgi:hypothetical protein